MNGQDLVRLVDAIRREKNIDAEIVFQGIEAALLSAAKKHFGPTQEVAITVSRETGEFSATLDGRPMDPTLLGRIAAQTAKQVMIQKIREAERTSIMQDYADQIGAIVTGQITRIEHGNAIMSLGRGEGFLPRSEQVPGEALHVGDRVRALIIDVREAGAAVKIVLSRTHPDLIVRLFELEVPEVADKVIVIEGVAREPGHRTKVAVSSIDTRVDAVGACVGIRGSRIKNIVEEVAGEKIDIVRYNESPQVFIANALKPAEVKEILLNRDIGRATVLVADDQLSLAIGKKGQNVRLAARLTGWNIDIMTPTEYDSQRTKAVEHLGGLPAVGAELAMDLMGAGYISLADVAEVEPEVLAKFANVDAARAKDIVTQAAALVAELEVKAGQDARVAASARALAEEAEIKDKASEAIPTDEPPVGPPAAGADAAAQNVETKPEA
jgi:N utilization substance protein A